MALFECLTLDFVSKYKITIQKNNEKIVHTFKHCNIFHFVKALKLDGWKILSCQEVLCYGGIKYRKIV